MSGIFGNLKNKITRKNSNSVSNPFVDANSTSAPTRKNSGLGRIMSKSNREVPTIVEPTSPAPATRRPPSSSTTNEPPPAYAAAPNAGTSLNRSLAPANASRTSIASSMADDPYAFLRLFDTIFLIDDSGSMAGRSWRETAAALETITPTCTAYDSDGIDVYFLNAKDSPFFRNIKDPGTVREIFSMVRPTGGTPTGQRLNAILKPYLKRYAEKPDDTKPLNIIVITDGEPSDDVESPIIAAAKKLDKLDAPAWQVGIQFFQVGSEPGARAHLKQLDDELAEIAGDDELRDMVDTVPFLGDGEAVLSGEGILKVVLGAVNRRLDRRRSSELHVRR